MRSKSVRMTSRQVGGGGGRDAFSIKVGSRCLATYTYSVILH